ncbi:MAG: ester cyclase [Chloroflexi bacterium]|nr:ester cyclase [Chloroflexota bacterium]
MESKDVALSVSKAILNGEWDKLDGILSSDFTYTGDGMYLNKQQYVEFMKGMRAAFSDMNFEFSHIVSEGDVVSIRFVVTAKHTGSFMGGAATNKNLKFSGIFMRKVKGDQVIQEWQATDLLGMMTQMGAGTLLGYTIFGVMFKKK